MTYKQEQKQAVKSVTDFVYRFAEKALDNDDFLCLCDTFWPGQDPQEIVDQILLA